MFDKLLNLPEELEYHVFGFIDDTTLCRLAGECAQIMKYYDYVLHKGFNVHKAKLSRVLFEYRKTISYSIDEKRNVSTYEYKGYIEKLPGVISTINNLSSGSIPISYNNIFRVSYRCDQDYNANCYIVLRIITFKSIKTNFDSIMWFNDGGIDEEMSRYSWSNYGIFSISNYSFDNITLGSTIWLSEESYTKRLEKRGIPPHFDEYDKDNTYHQYGGSIIGQIERFEKLGISRDTWKYSYEK
jgi:hypothetical protein